MKNVTPSVLRSMASTSVELLRPAYALAKQAVAARSRALLDNSADHIENLGDFLAGRRRRCITVVGDRVLVQYNGVPRNCLSKFQSAARVMAKAHEEIADIRVNPFLGRVVIRFVGAAPDESALDALVSGAEQAVDAGPISEIEEFRRVLPDDEYLDIKYALEAGGSALAFLSAVLMRIAPVVPRMVGDNLHTAVFIASVVPFLRRRIDTKLGEERSETAIHLAFSLAQILAQRPLSAVVGLVGKTESLRELRRRRRLWNSWAEELIRVDDETDLTDLPPARFPSLPQGPIERHVARTLYVAATTAAFSLITTANPLRAAAAGFAALPRPTRLGRDLFCTEVGRMFARQGILVLAPDALRRLDRINCLVLADSLIAKEKFTVDEVFALKNITKPKAKDIAGRLFDAAHPLRVQRLDNFALGPLPLLGKKITQSQERSRAERAASGALVLGLSNSRSLLALVEVRVSKKNSAATALKLARGAGMRVVIATDDPDAVRELSPDETIGLQTGLKDGVRKLQRQGRTVCLVAAGPSSGYASADLSVALHLSDQAAPWNAHAICPYNIRNVDLIIEACVAARLVSRKNVSVAAVTAGMGVLASTTGSSLSVAPRVVTVVNIASLVAMLNAVRKTWAIHRQRRTVIDQPPWHALEPEGVLALLGSSELGLRAPTPSTGRKGALVSGYALQFLQAIGAELMNPLTPLLALGAGVSAVVESKSDAAIVACVGLINAVVGGSQRFKAERAIARLLQNAETTVNVLRRGQAVKCSASELRPGDVLMLAQGDVVPADCRILDSISLEVDTAALTGEAFPVPKSAEPSFAENPSDIRSMVFAQNSVAAGRAKVVVVAVGDNTVAARARVLSRGMKTRGGVEQRLRQLMNLTGPVALVAGSALVITGLFRGRRIEDLVNTGVGLAVAAVPEGLPVLATAAQLSAAERLSRKGALVRNPRALEALGRVEVLCMDKTGTLSQGRVVLAKIFDGEFTASLEDLHHTHLDVLHVAALSVSTDSSTFEDPMDEAIIQAAKEPLADELKSGFERFAERAFESGRGYEAVAGRIDDHSSVFVKGSPELLLEKSTSIRWAKRRAMTPARLKRLYKELDRLSAEGLRVIAVAKREFQPSIGSDDTALDDLSELTFHGFLAFRDPIRPRSREMVADLSRAGVKVVMITGDHPNTALNVALEAGIVQASDDSNVLKGGEINQLNDYQLLSAASNVSVFARITPAQKVRIVRALQQGGRVVGMVGDGVNDAAAMRVADAGIAMGKNSSEAARVSSDVVLHDVGIDKILEVVVEGRAMWTSVRHAVSILLGGNLGEIAFTVAIGALTGRSPLTPRQFLVVNFLTDIAPSMAIALQPPNISDMNALREASPQNVLGKVLNREIAARALCTSFGAGAAWTAARLTGSSGRARTIGLAALVGSQLGQTFRTGSKNRSVRWTCLGSSAALFAIIQTPGLSQLFGCTPLGPLGWATALTASAGASLISPVVDLVVDKAADQLVNTTYKR